jgi:P27 family predicted phage terminase small subunit
MDGLRRPPPVELPPPGDPLADLLIAPMELSESAQACWRTYAPYAVAERTLTAATVLGFQELCEKFAIVQGLRNRIDVLGTPASLDVPAAEDPFDVPPSVLDGQVSAQQEWTRVAPLLRRRRQITETDRAALIALCLEWGRYIDASRNASPWVIKTAAGTPAANPWLSIQTRALAGCVKLWPQLGLTPSSRERVALDGSSVDGGADETLRNLVRECRSQQASLNTSLKEFKLTAFGKPTTPDKPKASTNQFAQVGVR